MSICYILTIIQNELFSPPILLSKTSILVSKLPSPIKTDPLLDVCVTWSRQPQTQGWSYQNTQYSPASLCHRSCNYIQTSQWISGPLSCRKHGDLLVWLLQSSQTHPSWASFPLHPVGNKKQLVSGNSVLRFYILWGEKKNKSKAGHLCCHCFESAEVKVK